MILPLGAQRRPCIFCGRPTAYFKRGGVDCLAHAAPSCAPFAGLLEQLASHIQVASEDLLREALAAVPGGSHDN